MSLRVVAHATALASSCRCFAPLPHFILTLLPPTHSPFFCYHLSIYCILSLYTGCAAPSFHPHPSPPHSPFFFCYHLSIYCIPYLSTLACCSAVDIGNFGWGVETSELQIDALEKLNWLDRQTKAVTIELVSVNANIMLINRCEVHFAFDLAGHVTSTVIVTSVPFFSAYDLRLTPNCVRIAVEIIFVIFTLLLVVAELRELLAEGPLTYIKDVSNYVDIAGLICAFGLLATWITGQFQNRNFKMPVMDFDAGLSLDLKHKIMSAQKELSDMAETSSVFDVWMLGFALVAVVGMIKAFMFHPKLGVGELSRSS